MKIQLKSNEEDLTIVTKGGGNIIVPNNTDTSTDKTLATVDQIGPVGRDKANAASLADPYESDHSSAYVVGDYVTHEGTLYKCKSDTSSPPGEWDDNNWDPVAVTDEMGGGVGDRIVSQNERTEVVANQDGTASIIDNEGQKGLNIPEGFSFSGISFEESGLVAFSGPYKLNGAPSNAWFWLPPGVDPSTWEYGTTTPAHIFLGGTSESEPVAVLHNGFMPLYAISGWNTDNPTLTRSQSAPYLPEDITVAMVPLEKTVATVDQMPTDTVSHQELDDALFNKVSQNAQFRMSIKDDGKVVVSGCRYRSANSTIQPFLNTYCVVSSETSLFDGGGGKIDFKIFNSTNDELLYRAVGYVTGNWTVLQNNLTSEAASYLPNVGGNIQFPIIITTNPENKVLEVYLTGSGVTLHPWSNFTSWADSKTKTLATLQNIAADFSMDSTYAVGDYVTYDGSLWKCKVAVITAGQWTGSDNWEEFIVTDEMGGGGGGGSAYYEIEYLESTGTQYIDTGIVAGLGVRVVADMEWVTAEVNDCAFGSAYWLSNTISNRYFITVSESNNSTYYGVGSAGTFINPQTSAVALQTGVRTIVDYSLTSSTSVLLLNGETAISQSDTFSFSSDVSIYAFARHRKTSSSNSVEYPSKIKLYSLKIYSGDTLVRDYVPVRSGFDFGLFDKVSRTFFVNQGTGLFLGGQDVNPSVPTESPAFTGTPTAPTAAAGTNTTQIATTEFVQTAIGDINSVLDAINGEEI